MTTKKITFVNPNFQQGPSEFNAYYLPYTPGVLWSYAAQFDIIKENYSLGGFIWRRDDIQKVVTSLMDSDVVVLCTYVWNRSYNHVIGREIKKANPNVFVIAGGPEPPVTDKNFFEKFPYIDVCGIQEGEKSFLAVLQERAKENPDYTHIKGLLVNDNGKTINTGPATRIDNLDDIPSPYLTGIFDELIKENPDINWNVTIETNRGCPYRCTFCDWGSLTYSKVKKFSIERVFSELDWAAQHSCDYLHFTDANFGIFPERDMAIAKKLVAVQKEYGYPKTYGMAWAKNQKKEVVDIVKLLMNEGGNKIGLNLSVQSMDENTLTIIKRKNLGIHQIAEVFQLCEENNIPLFTELILGLPGETLETWKNNFYALYKAGNHTGITVYQAQLLENAEMNLIQKEEYDLKGQVVYDYLVGTYNKNELREGVEVVVSTKDLTPEKMNQAQVHSWYQNTFHVDGITNYISRVMYTLYGVEYSNFYEGLFEHIKTDLWLNSEIARISKYFRGWGEQGAINHPPIQGIEIHGHNLIYSTIINISSQLKHNSVLDVVESYLRKTFTIEESLLQDMMTLQRNYLIDYANIKTYPKVIEFKHDIIGYVQGQSDINTPAKYEFDFPEDKNVNLKRFCEQLFFARRRNFGKAWLTKL